MYDTWNHLCCTLLIIMYEIMLLCPGTGIPAADCIPELLYSDNHCLGSQEDN